MNPIQVHHDTYVLLGLGILILGFVAYEIAGLTLPGWHTISWFAKYHSWLFTTILVGFMALGLLAPLWWVGHIRFGTISR